MWVEFKRVSNLITAEIWKDLLEGGGLPTKLLKDSHILDWEGSSPSLEESKRP